MMKKIRCVGCGGYFAEIEGPTHKYMESSPGCWAAYGEILAREYSDPAYFEVHRLTVDTHAVQHPGGLSRQSIQSVGLHLIRLYLFLERSLVAAQANEAMLKAGKFKHQLTWLEPPLLLGPLTIADLTLSGSATSYKAAVRKWAQSTWEAWLPHHDQVKTWSGWVDR